MGKEKTLSTLDERIAEALKDAPTIKGMTIMDLSRYMDEPWETVRWHLEKLHENGKVRYVPLGRGKIYSLEDDTPLYQKNR